MESTRTNLSKVEPPEIRHALIRKLREHLKKGLHHNHGMSLPCPYNKDHFALHTFTQFNGMEMFHCHQCGYRYIMVKQDGEKLLINIPETKSRLKRRIKNETENK